MVLEIIPTENENFQKLVLNGFVISEGTMAAVAMQKGTLEYLAKLHRVYCYEEHTLNKTTGAPESDLRITFHIHKV